MFTNLLDLSKPRNGVQAIGFYIFYLIIGLILVAALSALFSMVYCVCNAEVCQTYEQGVAIGKKVGFVVGLISVFLYIFGLGMWILKAKKLFQSGNAIFLFVFSIILAIPFGAIAALIPLAIMTKFEGNNNNSDEEEPNNSSVE